MDKFKHGLDCSSEKYVKGIFLGEGLTFVIIFHKYVLAIGEAWGIVNLLTKCSLIVKVLGTAQFVCN
jgi:hypothetical protein